MPKGKMKAAGTKAKAGNKIHLATKAQITQFLAACRTDPHCEDESAQAAESESFVDKNNGCVIIRDGGELTGANKYWKKGALAHEFTHLVVFAETCGNGVTWDVEAWRRWLLKGEKDGAGGTKVPGVSLLGHLDFAGTFEAYNEVSASVAGLGEINKMAANSDAEKKDKAKAQSEQGAYLKLHLIVLCAWNKEYCKKSRPSGSTAEVWSKKLKKCIKEGKKMLTALSISQPKPCK